MPAYYSDAEIKELIEEEKILPESYKTKLQLRNKRGHRERELAVDGVNGHKFSLVLRQSVHNELDFSAILGVYRGNTTDLFRLRRYNGLSHEHTNPIENETFYGFHIHTATERYQLMGLPEETFAQLTDRYADYVAALAALFADCGFEISGEDQMSFGLEF